MKSFFVAFATVIAVVLMAPCLRAETRPNFVFLLTDDISPGDLSVYGNVRVQTPHLDRIAARGLVFDNAYLTISSCSPSRCSMITGRYPHNTGAPELHQSLPLDQHTFVQSLHEAGYYTILSGKNHMGKPETLGFDVSSDSNPAGSEKWVKSLRQRPTGQPFFAWFASHDAHHEFTINDKSPTYPTDEIDVPPMMFDGPGTREELAGFYHEVSRTDYYAGEVLKELERQGIADNTYFIYCSDNGRPFPRCKTYLYNSGIRTPLIISGPNVVTGRTHSLVSSIDYSATFLQLAGIEKPASVQGVSMVPILSDPTAQVRNVAFAERNWHVFQNHQRAVRTGDWLYIWNAWPERYSLSGESATYRFPAVKELWEAAEAGQLTDAQALLTIKPQPTEMLFNVKLDPHQFQNLATMPESFSTLEKMRILLGRWQAETADTVPAKPTPDRQDLHEPNGGKIQRGDLPGEDRESTKINAPGPITIAS